MGIPIVTKTQLLPLQSKEGPLTLDDYKQYLVLNRLPFLLDWPVMHETVWHNYTAIRAEDDTEALPRISALVNMLEVVTTALNLPRPALTNTLLYAAAASRTTMSPEPPVQNMKQRRDNNRQNFDKKVLKKF